MNEQILDALRQTRYRVLTNQRDLEAIYRLRYNCYRSEGSIVRNGRGLMTDEFDESDNCLHVVVERQGKALASVRLHLLSSLSRTSPTAEVFPEILPALNNGQSILDPTRFVIDPEVRRQKISLHFLVLRIPFLAAMFYNVDLALAPVRAEHAAFYRRYLGYETAFEARRYPGLRKPVQLLTAEFRKQRDVVLARTPMFGPIAEIPEANIAFPNLYEIRELTSEGRSDVA